jgi:hypothetical protein
VKLTQYAFGLVMSCGCLQSSTLCVRVVDLAKQPLPVARVSVRALNSDSVVQAMETDRSGSACAHDISAGVYVIDISKAGFLEATFKPIVVSPEHPTRVPVTLPFAEIVEGGVRELATVSGTLRDDTGAVKGATICVLDQTEGRTVICVTTNELGEYTIPLVPGEYEVKVTTARKKTWYSKLDVPTPGIYRDRLK